jgi:hypothetical protein
MKATLEFNLPEDEQAHQYALGGHKYARAIEGVLEEMRGVIKYGNNKAAAKHAEVWRKKIFDAFAYENIVLP